MSAAPLRVALIGCGWYATNHLHAWRDLAPDGVELIDVPRFTSADQLFSSTAAITPTLRSNRFDRMIRRPSSRLALSR